MPHNGIGSGATTEVMRKQNYSRWKTRCETICNYIDNRNTGVIETDAVLLKVIQPSFRNGLPSLFKFIFILITKGIKTLGFAANMDCNGCGICKQVCVADNIELVDGRPIWHDHCEGCFACYHWCPKKAVSLGGHDLNVRHYHHPEVHISDIMNQKGTL
jgi:ferredoxin